jgi:hypothetical protein
MTSIEGYGGRAGNHQYAFTHCIKGIGSEDVVKRIAKREVERAQRVERERKEADEECDSAQE